MLSLSLMYYMGCCEDYFTCEIAFNVVMPLSRASTRGRYSRIEGVTLLQCGGGGLPPGLMMNSIREEQPPEVEVFL